MAQANPRRSFYLAIEQYGDLIGCATLDILSFPHRQGEIGLYLRPDRWAEGLGTETARLLLELAFSRLALHRVQTTVDPRNTPGMRVAEHIKMRPEGVLLDRFLVAGQWQDRAMYAITLPEWRGGGGRHAGAQEAGDAAQATAEAGTADAAVTTTSAVSFGGGPEEPALGAPIPAQAEEPLVGETLIDDTEFAEPLADDDGPSEPQVLTAQIVTEQIEVVHILPRKP
jgi:hypothetical protein